MQHMLPLGFSGCTRRRGCLHGALDAGLGLAGGAERPDMQALASAIKGKMTSIVMLCHGRSNCNYVQMISGAPHSSTRTLLIGWLHFNKSLR